MLSLTSFMSNVGIKLYSGKIKKMVLNILGAISGISILGKIVFQILLDRVSYSEDGKKPHIHFRARDLLPYDAITPPEYMWMRKTCNVLYRIFIVSTVLYLVLWNVQK